MAFPDIDTTVEVNLRIAESSGSLAELNEPVFDVSDEEITHSSDAGSLHHDCFEGPEKTIEVCFEPGIGNENGLRDLTRQQLDHLCTQAKCTILSHISSNHLDAYVLSESSLFVYKHRWIMKTCGTTTLLRCLNSLFEYADNLGMTIRWVGYSRKNLNNPSAQSWPHSNFGDEIAFLNSNKKLQERLNGVGHILGPVTGDHWFVYVADLPRFSAVSLPPIPSEISLPYGTLQLPTMIPVIAEKPPLPADSISSLEGITLNMMMFDLDLEVAKIFYKKEGCETGEAMTRAAGIHHIVPGATIDAAAFTPCGYSMNSILHDSYSTIHITPEPQCSYASYETNTSLPSYLPLVRNVLNVFGPKRFILTLFADESALKNLNEPPAVAFQRIIVPRFGTYSRKSVSSTTVEGNVSCLMICLAMDESRTSPLGKSSPTLDDPLFLRERTRTE
jgi:S-adenosylmethionine decarboxylase